MPEFEYRGYRVRTLFDKTWQIKVWPPLSPARLTERVRASRAEGETACRSRATAMIDRVLTRKNKGRYDRDTREPGVPNTLGASSANT